MLFFSKLQYIQSHTTKTHKLIWEGQGGGGGSQYANSGKAINHSINKYLHICLHKHKKITYERVALNFKEKTKLSRLTAFSKHIAWWSVIGKKRERKTKQNNKHRIINPCTWKEKKWLLLLGSKGRVCEGGEGIEEVPFGGYGTKWTETRRIGLKVRRRGL